MARDTRGNLKVDFVWGNLPMQPNTDRATPLDPALDNHGIVYSRWGGFPAFVPNNDGSFDDITVPNVVGLTVAAATNALVAVGLGVGTISDANNAAGATAGNDGKVKTQTPAAATVIDPSDGTADLDVDLVIFDYTPPIIVPDVVGLTQAAATAALVAEGLSVGTVTTADNAAGATSENDGTVKEQTPAAATAVDPSDPGASLEVDLVIFDHTP